MRAERQVYAVPRGSDKSSEERRKLFVHSVLFQLTAAVYRSPSDKGSDGDSGISADMARKVYAQIDSILQRFVSEAACRCFVI